MTNCCYFSTGNPICQPLFCTLAALRNGLGRGIVFCEHDRAARPLAAAEAVRICRRLPVNGLRPARSTDCTTGTPFGRPTVTSVTVSQSSRVHTPL